MHVRVRCACSRSWMRAHVCLPLFLPSLIMIRQRAAEKLAYFLFGKMAIICSRVAEKWAYFLFGGFAVKFDWLLRPNNFEFEYDFWHICSAWSEDHKIYEDKTEFVACGYVLWRWTTFKWWPNSDVSMRNNLLAIWGGLTVSPDIENKFEIYSSERGVITHLH